MKTLPTSPDLDHLKKQAKRLLRDARAGHGDALRRFVETLPAARGMEPSVLAQYPLALHDAQSVIARECGFKSWTELKRFVEWKHAETGARLNTWLTWIFEGNARQRALALRLLGEEPELFRADPAAACAIGDETRVRAALARDPAWVGQKLGPFAMPPLVIVTHSRLIAEPAFEAGLLACAAQLVKHGADVNATWSDARWPDSPLSALYGAAGRTHHAGMTGLLLDAGASPDDNESLYHSVESPDLRCTELLLDAGARVVGTNAIARVLDYDRIAGLKLLLSRGGDAAERPWTHHAILRGRSMAHVRALVDAGADLHAANDRGVTLYRFARIQGRTDVVELLHGHGVEEALSREEQFVAACTCADVAAAYALAGELPDVVARLDPQQLETMPRLAGIGEIEAVRTMLALGWPREVKTGWDATALNHAVFQGDAAMARLLFEAGADWRTPHGFGDNVLGTLSFASQFEDVGDPAPRDYVGCAEALVSQGVPLAAFDGYGFPADVRDVLDRLRLGV